MTAEAVRALLAADHVTHVPGVWDPLSTALAVRAGHRAVLLAGDAVAAVALGRLDGGAVSATVVADRATTLAASLGGVPLLADAGTGFDSPRPAVWTGLAYHRAGVSGVVLEGDAVATVAALAQEVPELAVIVRVGTRANGFGAIVDRCRLYATAGATAVLPVGLDDPDDLVRLHRALPGVPLVLDRSEAAGESPTVSDAALVRAGVRLVLHPLTALLAAARAASLTYRALTEEGAVDQVERMPWAAFTELAEPAPASTPATTAATTTATTTAATASALDRLQT
jgi:methylisocitrate lyase